MGRKYANMWTAVPGSRVAPQSVARLTSAGHVSSRNSTVMLSLDSSAWKISKIARLSTSPFCDWNRSWKPPLG